MSATDQQGNMFPPAVSSREDTFVERMIPAFLRVRLAAAQMKDAELAFREALADVAAAAAVAVQRETWDEVLRTPFGEIPSMNTATLDVGGTAAFYAKDDLPTSDELDALESKIRQAIDDEGYMPDSRRKIDALWIGGDDA